VGRRISYYILIIIGIIGILDTLFLMTFTYPDTGILLPGVAGSLLVVFSLLKLKVYRRRPIISNPLLRLVVYALIIVFAFSFVLVEGMIVLNSDSDENIDSEYILILGAGIRGETVSLTLKERLDIGIDYLNRHPDSKVVVSGGQGPGEEITEAEAMKRYLLAHGIEPHRIIVEDRATSTMENFYYTRELLAGLEGREVRDIAIVTSDFHMMRAKMLARRNGFEPVGIAGTTPAVVWVNSYLREYFAFIKSFFVDRTGKLPAAQKAGGTVQDYDSSAAAAEEKPEIRIINPSGNTVNERINTPEGFERVPVREGSFAEYLRNLPLKPHAAKVMYYDGRVKARDVHDAVIDIDVGERDLQQCADAVIRLRAEYLYSLGEYDRIHFDFTNGFRTDYTKWMEGYRIRVEGNDARWVKTAEYRDDYESFRDYLDIVFAYAGTISLAQEMKPVALEEMQPGDVFIQADPGHCVIVIDMARNKETGERLFMIAQSYMPAQDIHILKNTQNKQISPWYSLDFGDVLVTPEWKFTKNDLKRFAD